MKKEATYNEVDNLLRLPNLLRNGISISSVNILSNLKIISFIDSTNSTCFFFRALSIIFVIINAYNKLQRIRGKIRRILLLTIFVGPITLLERCGNFFFCRPNSRIHLSKSKSRLLLRYSVS